MRHHGSKRAPVGPLHASSYVVSAPRTPQAPYAGLGMTDDTKQLVFVGTLIAGSVLFGMLTDTSKKRRAA